MRIFTLIAATLLLNMGPFLRFAGAEPPADAQREVEHLIAYVKDSGRTFIRNGEEKPADEAASHIGMKYSRGKSRIKTTEEFIEGAASKSMLSGKPYLVRLPDGAERPVREWLLEELARYRQNL